MESFAKIDILPDSRPKEPKGRVFQGAVSWIPIFCANCGADGGLVPEENCNFAFYLCNQCAETHGQVPGHMMMPDQVFWERIKQEELDSFGRFLDEIELAQVLEADASPLATLIKSGR